MPTKKKTKRVEWVKKWCRAHAEELRTYQGSGLTLGIHKKHGIVMTAINASVALHQLDFIKDSIVKGVQFIGAAAANKLAGNKSALQQITESVEKTKVWDAEDLPPAPEAILEPTNDLPDLAPPVDPFDNDLTLDGGLPGMASEPVEETKSDFTLVRYAWNRGLKSIEVLMKLLGRGDSGVNVNTVLTEEQVKHLDEAFADKIKKQESPFPSPDPQPPFTPRTTHDPRDIVIDGGGGGYRNWRNTRFD